MLMGAGGGMVTAQIPVTPEDNSLVCRLNAHTPTPDQMHTAAGVYECVCMNITGCLTAAKMFVVRQVWVCASVGFVERRFFFFFFENDIVGTQFVNVGI